MSFHFADIARHAANDGVVCEAEILELRRAGWADGRMTRAEAEALFAMQHALTKPDAAWADFFIDAIRNFVLEGTAPIGHASEEEAEWLISQVESDGKICSLVELELLVGLIEKARNVPERLKAYVLEILEREVLSGTGPVRRGGELSATHVSDAECAIIRRVIFGQASDRPASVSRREAEMLFRIKDSTLEEANSAEFKRLFVQGVGNFLLGYANEGAQLSRSRALELEAFVANNKVQIGRFMGTMARSAPKVYGLVFGRKHKDASREERVAEAQAFTQNEKDWLDAQISKNGQTDHYDEALLAFLAEETGE